MTQQRIIGSSKAMSAALDHASLLASINRPVLILGERGSGKELIAERIHYLSPRWDKPMIKVNCGAISETLLDSELFGHESGAFTGATSAHKGRFERAQGGTLFLDELGTMSGQLQEKLLRVIEYGELERVGGNKTIQVDVRVLGATHESLQDRAQAGTFRADLLDRLSFDVVQVPSLRDRIEDIPELADFFAMKFSQELEWPLFPGFTKTALGQLSNHSWPGNIRELKNAVERSIFRHGNYEKPVNKVSLNPFSEHILSTPISTPIPSGGDNTGTKNIAELAFTEAVDQFKISLLSSALENNQYNHRKSAESLGLSYDQFRGMVRKFKL